MGDGADGLIVSQACHQSAIDNLENGSFRLDRGVGSLIENAPHVAVAFWGAVVLGYPRALFVSRRCSHPGRELLGGRNVTALAPTSAMICCAESTPRPGTSAKCSTASWCGLSRLASSWSSWLICWSINCNSSRNIFNRRR